MKERRMERRRKRTKERRRERRRTVTTTAVTTSNWPRRITRATRHFTCALRHRTMMEPGLGLTRGGTIRTASRILQNSRNTRTFRPPSPPPSPSPCRGAGRQQKKGEKTKKKKPNPNPNPSPNQPPKHTSAWTWARQTTLWAITLPEKKLKKSNLKIQKHTSAWTWATPTLWAITLPGTTAWFPSRPPTARTARVTVRTTRSGRIGRGCGTWSIHLVAVRVPGKRARHRLRIRTHRRRERTELPQSTQ
mmetsp:Transcript_6327/g.23882  ORF Transcript_6327/g.23882 Transcript_6327/m.23882 type:complete len:248 (+) Transcript_6327:724-1467(+)